MKQRITEQDRIDREAADWVVKWADRERDPAPREQSRWFSWLQRSSRNVQSYFDVAELHDRLGRMDPGSKIDVDDWLAGRRAPVVTIASVESTSKREKPHPQVSRGIWWAAATLAAGLGGVVLWTSFVSGAYRTSVGQQSVNRLDDGSVVNLNTQSRVKVAFSGKTRFVELKGEALFTVAHDPARPFLVRTHDATILAVGTQFNVYEQAGETRVAVVEGVVRVTPSLQASRAPPARQVNVVSPAISEGVALSAGETARVSHGQVAKDRKPNIEAQVSWQRQKLVFEDAPLAEVAAEFNRYNTRRFRVEGPVGQTKRLSGTFDALHPQSLLLYLQKDDSVTVQLSGDDFIVRDR